MNTENSQPHPSKTEIANLPSGDAEQVIAFLMAENRILKSKLDKRSALTATDRGELTKGMRPIKKLLGNTSFFETED